VAEHDLEKLLKYTEKRVTQELGASVNVTPLSSRPDRSALLKKWIDDQITPRIANARKLAQESNARKANNLAQRVLHALEVISKTRNGDHTGGSDDDLRKAEARLRDAATLVDATSVECYRMTRSIRESSDTAIASLADSAISEWQTDGDRKALNGAWIQKKLNSLAQAKAEEVVRLIQATARELSKALEGAARVTAGGEHNEPAALDALVREVPVPEFMAHSLELRRPCLLSISTQLAARSVRATIKSNAGTVIESFFNSYGRALELWFHNVLDRLDREFNAGADIYRAQLQRLTSSGEVTPGGGESFQREISALRQTVSAWHGIRT